MLAILAASILHPASQEPTLNVFAAASLKEAFTIIAHNYEAIYPTPVRLNFAGSQTLAAQINQGAPADVFASAAEKNLHDIQFDPASLRVFALNHLKIAVRKGLPGIQNVRDLAKVRNLVIADPAVPVGHYTEDFFAKAGRLYGAGWLRSVRSHIVSKEQDVKAVLTKVSLGEADAGIVYSSDVTTAGGSVASVEIPEELNETAQYPVAITKSAGYPNDAKHFIKFLLSAESQKVLEQSGLISPTRPVRSLLINSGNGVSSIPLPIAKLPEATVTTLDEEKHTRTYRGVIVTALPGISKSREVTFIGADLYRQTVATAELKARNAVLVRASDGNYQLIVPGLKPSVWVSWLRRIELH